jgi:hypothetical protein
LDPHHPASSHFEYLIMSTAFFMEGAFLYVFGLLLFWPCFLDTTTTVCCLDESSRRRLFIIYLILKQMYDGWMVMGRMDWIDGRI